MTKLETSNGVVYNIEEETDEVSEQELQAQETIDSILASFGNEQDVEVYIYRLHKDKSKAYICQLSASEFSLDMLRDKYKGGRFDVLIKHAGKLVKSRRITVEPPIEDNQQLAVAGENPNNMIFAMMQDSARRSDELLKVLLMKDKPEPQKSLFMTPEMITAFAAFLPAIKKLFDSGGAGESQLDTFIKAIEMGQKLAGGGEKETSLTDLLSKGLEALTVVAHQPKPSAQQQPQSEGEAQPQQIEDQTQGPQAMINVMKNKLAPLVEAAKNNEDFWPYVGLVFNKVPVDYIKAWVIDQADPVAALSKVDPQIEHYREWFTNLAAGIKEEWKEMQGAGEGDEGDDAATEG